MPQGTPANSREWPHPRHVFAAGLAKAMRGYTGDTLMLLRRLVLGILAFGVGVLGGAADFIVQKSRAGEGYGTAEYMVSLIERFDGAVGAFA